MEKLIKIFKEKLKIYKTEKKLTTFEILKEFDENFDKKINFTEFEKILKKIKISNFSNSEKKNLFFCLDRKNEENLDIIEFVKIQEQNIFDIINNRKNKVITKKFDEYKKNEILIKYLKKIKNFLKSKKISFLKLYHLLKKNGHNNITKKNFLEINKNVLKIFLKKNENEIIFFEIDKDNNGIIEYNEFCQFLNLEEIFKILKKKKNLNELKNNFFIKILYNLISEKKISIKKFIEKIDSDNNGKLDRIEFYNFFSSFFLKKGLNFDINEFDNFFNFCDQSHNNFIEIREIKLILETYEKFLSTPKKCYEEFFLQNILKKLRKLIKKFFYKLKINFEIKQDSVNFIKIEDFFFEIKKYNFFSDEEIEAIQNPLILPFTKFQRVNFLNFLHIEKFYKEEFHFLDKVENSENLEKNKKNGNFEIFRIIKKIGEKYGYDKFLLFSLFDKKKLGFITPENIFELFKEIGLDFRFEDIRESFCFIDKNHDMKINLTEFCAFFTQLDE